MNPQSLDIRLGEVLVEFPQVEDGQHAAEQIDQYPDGIEDIVSVGPLRVTSLCNYRIMSSYLDQRTGWFIHHSPSVCC